MDFKENIIGGQYRFVDFDIADTDFKIWWNGNPLNWKGEKILNLILDPYFTEYKIIRLKWIIHWNIRSRNIKLFEET